MKSVLAIAAIVMTSVAFIPAEKGTTKTKSYEIKWIGRKIGGEHKGTIKLKESNLEYKGEKLVGGSFIIDMNSMEVTDLDGEYADKLITHLKSDDFFWSRKIPNKFLQDY